MKTKKFLSLALALLLILALAACGSAKSSVTADTAPYPAVSAAPEAASGSSLADSEDKAVEPQTADMATTAAGTPEYTGAKKIYTGYADIETLDFEKTMSDLQQLIKSSGGYVESSSETGGDYNSMYNGRTVYRTASYTLRIPVEKFDEVYSNDLKKLGNVVNNNSGSQDITLRYTDSESRLKTYRTEEERLLDMLSKATTVEDMLAIETRLSDIRYQIETLTSQIKVWDSQVSYSTLSLSIREVALYTKDSASTVSYGEQLKQTFSHSLYSLGRFFMGLFKFLVAVFPALVVLAVIAVIVLSIVRASNRKKKAKLPPVPNAQNQDSGNDRPPFNQ